MVTPAGLGLSTNQFNNAKGIITAVKARGWGIKAAYIAVETVLTESGMHIIASANVPASKKYPHDLLSWTSDGLGHDHASMGMYQQQTGYAWTPAGYGRNMNQTTMDSPNGWGTPAELMSAQTSTSKFLNALARYDWSHMSNWAAAQAVQGSAYSDGSNYRQNDSRAITIVNALWSSTIQDWFDMATLAQLEAAVKASAGLAPCYNEITGQWSTLATVTTYAHGAANIVLAQNDAYFAALVAGKSPAEAAAAGQKAKTDMIALITANKKK